MRVEGGGGMCYLLAKLCTLSTPYILESLNNGLLGEVDDTPGHTPPTVQSQLSKKDPASYSGVESLRIHTLREEKINSAI